MLLNSCPAAPPPTPTPTITPTPSASSQRSAYLPLVSLRQISVLATLNDQAIPIRPITVQGETYYTTTIQLVTSLPPGGKFYFSASPQSVQPIQVDDELVVRINGQVQFSQIATTPMIVEIPRATLETWVGQSLEIAFRDVYGSLVGSSPVWLIWVP